MHKMNKRISILAALFMGLVIPAISQVNTYSPYTRFGLGDLSQEGFGQLPGQAEEMLKAVRLRWLAMQTGVEKIILKNHTLIAYFVSNPDALFYRSDAFNRIIGNIQRNPKLFRMRQDKDRLSLRVNHTDNIEKTIAILERLNAGEEQGTRMNGDEHY